MSQLHEHDAMICRACGREERASEGYPCADCGTFICIMCSFKGVLRCTKCTETMAQAAAAQPAASPSPAPPPTAKPADPAEQA